MAERKTIPDHKIHLIMFKIILWIIVITSCSLILILTTCHPVVAQSIHDNRYTLPQSIEPTEVTFQKETKIPEVLGYVNYINLETSKQTEEMYTFSTEKGDILIKLTRTKNIMCDGGCPDEIEVYGVPEGYVAVPLHAEVPEGSTLQIKIFQFLGG